MAYDIYGNWSDDDLGYGGGVPNAGDLVDFPQASGPLASTGPGSLTQQYQGEVARGERDAADLRMAGMIDRDRASWEQQARDMAAAAGVAYDPSDLQGIIRNLSYAANDTGGLRGNAAYWLDNLRQNYAQRAASNGGGGGGAAGAGAGGAAFNDYYAWGGPMAPDLSWLKAAPAFSFADFQAPGAEGMFADPGYQFRVDQGRKALEQSAAGRGTLRTGGTLKDILGYGQNMASQEYGNVFNRAMNAYAANLGTAKERYAPQLASWQSDQAARQSASNQAFNRAWDVYTYSHPSATTIFNAGLT